jgi:hypothetical protein
MPQQMKSPWTAQRRTRDVRLIRYRTQMSGDSTKHVDPEWGGSLVWAGAAVVWTCWTSPASAIATRIATAIVARSED